MWPLTETIDDDRSAVQPTLGSRVVLRSPSDSELPQVRRWLELADVDMFWGRGYENVAFFTRPEAGIGHRVVVVDGSLVGYVRWRIVDGARYQSTSLSRPLGAGATRMDVLIGPRERRFLGLGSIALRRAWEHLELLRGPGCYFGLSSVHQTALIRAYEKAGFRFQYYHDDVLIGPAVAMVRPTRSQQDALLRG